ncbi:Rieske (2Fe-2S) protein [Marinicauda algicola]|uniref:Rieske (2Fe-2S) protein n=1 Tax=Marinicauda algicola TaxID=2029849 RepID=UPI0019D2C25A|nr:Rieske (2Fe-2S) protein [Marinicauda algicola]
MSELPPPGTVLKRLADLPDPGGAPAEYEPLPVLVLRAGDVVRAYVNVCPHAGRPLCLPSGRTLVSEGHVVCPFHGASFDIESGACTGGPAGRTGLKPVPVKVEAGKVVAL